MAKSKKREDKESAYQETIAMAPLSEWWLEVDTRADSAAV